MQWVLRLWDALDTHKWLLENQITPVLMINLLWKVHQDSRQFFVGCERWEDGEPFPRSTLRTTVEALMDDVHINTTLTCPVAEFLGSSTPAIKPDKRDPGGTGKTAGGHGRQPTRNTAIPPGCAAAVTVREVNCLYPTMSISDFAQKGGVKYSLLQVGNRGDCTNFSLLGRCSESCPYKHIARPMADKKTRIVNEALKLGLKNLSAKPPA